MFRTNDGGNIAFSAEGGGALSALLNDLAMQIAIVVAAIGLLSGCVLYACLHGSNRYLHVLQLDSYQIDGYWRSMRRNANADLWPGWMIFAAVVATTVAFSYLIALESTFLNFAGILIPPVVFSIFAGALSKKRDAQKQKKSARVHRTTAALEQDLRHVMHWLFLVVSAYRIRPYFGC